MRLGPFCALCAVPTGWAATPGPRSCDEPLARGHAEGMMVPELGLGRLAMRPSHPTDLRHIASGAAQPGPAAGRPPPAPILGGVLAQDRQPASGLPSEPLSAPGACRRRATPVPVRLSLRCPRGHAASNRGSLRFVPRAPPGQWRADPAPLASCARSVPMGPPTLACPSGWPSLPNGLLFGRVVLKSGPLAVGQPAPSGGRLTRLL